MSGKSFVLLDGRGVLKLGGPDARPFLQGLVSNDVHKVAPGRAVYAAFLTPQGRYLHDFFIAECGGALLLDCEGPRLADLLRRLSMFKLRAKVTIEDASQAFAAAALWGEGAGEGFGLKAEAGEAKPFAGGVVFVDPRLPELGCRALLAKETAAASLREAGFAPVPFADYDRLRMTLGVPDGSRDLEIEKAILLENGFDELHGIDWDKGCYLGQELTARTKYRGLVRKRLLPVAIEGEPPPPGTPVMAGDTEAGEMRTSRDGVGLAMIRLEILEQAKKSPGLLTAGDAKLMPKKPGWAAF